jgi:hypothetical protein
MVPFDSPIWKDVRRMADVNTALRKAKEIMSVLGATDLKCSTRRRTAKRTWEEMQGSDESPPHDRKDPPNI